MLTIDMDRFFSGLLTVSLFFAVGVSWLIRLLIGADDVISILILAAATIGLGGATLSGFYLSYRPNGGQFFLRNMMLISTFISVICMLFFLCGQQEFIPLLLGI